MVLGMIEITSETDAEVFFTNVTSGKSFRAESRDHGHQWHVYLVEPSQLWGRAEHRGKVWYAYASNLRDRLAEPFTVDTRDEAFGWVTGDTDAV